MYGHFKRDKIRNKDICDTVRVTSLVNNTRGEIVMVCTCENEMHRCPTRRCEMLTMVGFMRGRGWPKKY